MHYIKLWLWAGIVLITTMVMIGGITRLTGSGLSIVEWKPISGTLPPITDMQWHQAFDQYKQFPEYKKLNHGMDLAHFKQLFFWEYIHRLLGRFIGLIFLIPFLFFYFKRWLSKPLTKKLLLIFSLGALQGAMGWYMVKSGLIDIPHVSHFRLAIHQSLALLLVASILWTLLSLDENRKTVWSNRSVIMFLPYASLLLLSLQTVLGAFVAGLKAGFSYTNFPFMGNSLFPSAVVMAAKPLLYNGVTLQFIHRWLGFVIVLTFIGLIKISKPFPEVYKYAKALIVIGAIQLGLGVATLILQVPIVLGVTHQFVAILLLMLLVKIIYALKYQTGIPRITIK